MELVSGLTRRFGPQGQVLKPAARNLGIEWQWRIKPMT